MACRQLGFSAVKNFDYRYHYHGMFWLTELGCKGTESSLAACSHRPWGYNNSYDEDIYLECYDGMKKIIII